VNEAVSTKGLRIFLKPQVVDDDIRYSRFLSPVNSHRGLLSWMAKEMPVRLLGGLKDFKLTPLRGFYYSLVQRPIGDLTQRLGSGRLEPSLPVLMLLSALAWQGIDDANKVAVDWKIQSQITDNRGAFQHLLQYDFRFHEIDNEMRAGEITEDQALLQSFWRKLAIDKYYRERANGIAQVKFSDQVHYLNFFTHLKSIVKNGVTEQPGFLVSEIGPLTDQQISRLFDINHRLFTEYQIIEEMTHNSEHFNYLKSHPFYRDIVNDLIDDPFTREIVRLWNNRQISADQAEHILQEDAFWRARFKEWKTIGVTCLKDDDSKVPLTLQDIRDEIIQRYGETQHPAS
jgi:hypothetical protein